MADPYAARVETLTGQAPAGPPPWTAAVGENGGVIAASVAELGELDLDQASLVAILCRGAGLLAPVARVSPAAAVALLLTHGEASADAMVPNAAVDFLAASGRDAYAIKHGWVAGPEGRPGAVEITATLVGAVLSAAAAGRLPWERDPDFGYEVAAAVPGVDGAEALALSPRLLYTDLGRAYEHAALVVATKDERRAALEAIQGLDPTILAALG